MIPFDEIDNRLSAIGKDRKWLASAAGYKPSSIRDALAPGSKTRTERIQKALSDAIESEESKCNVGESPLELPQIFLTTDQLTTVEKASRIAHAPDIKTYCRDVLIAEAQRLISAEAAKQKPNDPPDEGTLPRTGTDD